MLPEHRLFFNRYMMKYHELFMVDKKTTNNMTYCNDKNCQNGACKYHKKLNSDTATGVNGNPTCKEQGGAGGSGDVKDISEFTVISEKKVNKDGSFIPMQVITNKEELRNKFEDRFSVMLSRAEREDGESAENWTDSIIDFFWNEIEKIRKEDMERVDKGINNLTPFGIGIPQDPLVSKESVLSIIKQAHD